MKIIENPSVSEWNKLCVRPSIQSDQRQATVQEILRNIKENGDVAVRYFAEKLDKFYEDDLLISQSIINKQAGKIDVKLKSAIDQAYANIWKFHKAQKKSKTIVDVQPGLCCWTETKGIDRVGLYIPGGSAPLFSTLLMLGIPAKLAGCQEIVVCTPLRQSAMLNPATAYILKKLGIEEVYPLGGAQAVATMAYGTQKINPVQLIAGPGNQYVTEAKMQVQQAGVAIDMPAGPSEVLVIADASSNPSFVAADLLSQAEHGADSQVILCSTDRKLIEETIKEIESQVQLLPRKETAKAALENSRFILFEKEKDAVAFSNYYAPEHLIIATKNCEELANAITNAGSVFIGKYSCESAGDYASGTNHTLPTNGFAKAYSGVSVATFQKTITYQKLESEALLNLGPVIEVMAEAEGLQAHKNAVSIRLKSLTNEN